MLFIRKESEIDIKKNNNNHQGKGAAPVFHWVGNEDVTD